MCTIAERQRVTGIKSDGCTKIGYRLVGVARGNIDSAAIRVRGLKVRAYPDRRIKIDNRFISLADSIVDVSPSIVRGRVVGSEPDCTIEVLNGVLVIVLFSVSNAPVTEG